MVIAGVFSRPCVRVPCVESGHHRVSVQLCEGQIECQVPDRKSVVFARTISRGYPQAGWLEGPSLEAILEGRFRETYDGEIDNQVCGSPDRGDEAVLHSHCYEGQTGTEEMIAENVRRVILFRTSSVSTKPVLFLRFMAVRKLV